MTYAGKQLVLTMRYRCLHNQNELWLVKAKETIVLLLPRVGRDYG